MEMGKRNLMWWQGVYMLSSLTAKGTTKLI